MKIIFKSLLTVALALFVSANASAQPAEGMQEVTASAAFFRPIGTGSGTFAADASYGYFFDDALQVGLRQSYNLIYDDDARDQWYAVTAPFVNYHFVTSKDQTIVPYVGAFVGGVWDDHDFTGTTGPQVGVKAYLSKSTFAAVNYRYEWFFDDLDQFNDTLDSNHVVTVGLGYTW